MTAEINMNQSQCCPIMVLSVVLVCPAFTVGIPTAHVGSPERESVGCLGTRIKSMRY